MVGQSGDFSSLLSSMFVWKKFSPTGCRWGWLIPHWFILEENVCSRTLAQPENFVPGLLIEDKKKTLEEKWDPSQWFLADSHHDRLPNQSPEFWTVSFGTKKGCFPYLLEKMMVAFFGLLLLIPNEIFFKQKVRRTSCDSWRRFMAFTLSQG